MKRTLWNITLASVATLVAYVALYAIWGAILSGLNRPTLALFLVAAMTTLAFGFVLLAISKIRGSVGEREVLADYKDGAYTSLSDDFRLVLKREARTLLAIAAVAVCCFALNTFDKVVFERKTISVVTLLFAPLCLFDTCIPVPFVGYALSALLDCVAYLAFLLLYRKKKYNYWRKSRA